MDGSGWQGEITSKNLKLELQFYGEIVVQRFCNGQIDSLSKNYAVRRVSGFMSLFYIFVLCAMSLTTKTFVRWHESWSESLLSFVKYTLWNSKLWGSQIYEPHYLLHICSDATTSCCSRCAVSLPKNAVIPQLGRESSQHLKKLLNQCSKCQ